MTSFRFQNGNAMERNQVGAMLPSFSSFTVIMEGKDKYHIPTKEHRGEEG